MADTSLWFAALVPVSAFAGAVAGALINRTGPANAARVTIAGQREIARDAALREWRKQQVEPYLEAAERRVRAYVAMYDTLHAGNVERAAAMWDEFMTPSMRQLTLLIDALPASPFREAYNQLLDAQQRWDSTLRPDGGPLRAAASQHDLLMLLGLLQTAMSQVYRTAETYIHEWPEGTPPSIEPAGPPWWQRWRRR
jgi:hypothetical protein